MVQETAATTGSGSALTRAEMHAYYIAFVTMTRVVFDRAQLVTR